jgi:hypothetical protein
MRILIVFTILLITACSSPGSLTQPENSQNLIGEWRYSPGDAPLDFAHWFIFKHQQGTATSGACLSSRGEGTWRLAGNTLYIDIVDPRDQLQGLNASYSIVSWTESQLVLKDTEDSETYTLNRQN